MKKVYVCIVSCLLILIFACGKERTFSCPYSELLNSETEKISDNSHALGGEIKFIVKKNLEKMGSSNFSIELKDSSILSTKEKTLQISPEYDQKFLSQHNSIIQILCSIDQDLQNDKLSKEERKTLVSEKIEKRTEYFNLLVRGNRKSDDNAQTDNEELLTLDENESKSNSLLFGYANVNKTKLRAEPNIESEILARLRLNAKVQKIKKTGYLDTQTIKSRNREIEIDDYWHFVKIENGLQGWIFGYFLEDEIIEVVEIDKFVLIKESGKFVNANRTKLRVDPDSESEILSRLDINTKVIASKRTNLLEDQKIISKKSKNFTDSNYWYYCSVPSLNKKGWIFGYFISDNAIEIENNNVALSPEKVIPLKEINEEVSTSEIEQGKEEIEVILTEKEIPESYLRVDERKSEKKTNYQVKYQLNDDFKLRGIDKGPNSDYSGFETGVVVIKLCINKYGNIEGNPKLIKRKSSSTDKLIKLAISKSYNFKFNEFNEKKQCEEITFSFKEVTTEK